MLNKNLHFISRILKQSLWSIAVLILTTVHHLYGAVIYQTPWRGHVAHPAALTIILIAVALFIFSRRPNSFFGRTAFWIAVSVIVVIPIGFFGLYEGGYNHVLKDVLYFSRTSQSAMDRLFPQPLYEMPDDVFFEITGILTFFVAIPAAYSVYRLFLFRKNAINTHGINLVR
jgi:hypothetical protein